MHNQAFDGLTGKFPIGFLIWKTNQSKRTALTEIAVDVLDKDAQPIGKKTFFTIPNKQFLSEWIARPKTNGVDVVPLKNATTPATAKSGRMVQLAVSIVQGMTYNTRSNIPSFFHPATAMRVECW